MVARNPHSPLDSLLRNIQYNELNMTFPSAISTGIMRSTLGKVNIPEARATQDFFGIYYYSVDTIAFDLTAHKTFYPEAHSTWRAVTSSAHPLPLNRHAPISFAMKRVSQSTAALPESLHSRSRR